MKQILAVLLLTTVMWAGTGLITGKVYDRDTGNPLPDVTVQIEGTTFRATTDKNGAFIIKGVSQGSYSLVAVFKGYSEGRVHKLIVRSGQAAAVSIYLARQRGENNPDHWTTHSRSMFRSPAEGILSISPEAGKVSKMYQTRSDASGFAEETILTYNTEEYTKIDETGFKDVLTHPFSTFAADVDGAAYANARRFILMDQLPYKDVVRTEEFVNYFDYDYPSPKDGSPLSVTAEAGPCPWNSAARLVHIGLKGRTLAREDQQPGNLVFLIDVSGSMDSPKKLPLLKNAFRMLVENLNPADRVAIVVYAGKAGLVLPATEAASREKILAALDELKAGGSTAGGEGIRLAYDVAKENYIRGGNNRVILATDGDFNVGVSSTSELVRLIEEKRDEGIFLTVLGFGMGNYKDNRLQELADRGNGNHAYIDNILEAKKVLVDEVTATLFTIAKDVKIQVEFNPAKVKSYRLIGYENRRLAPEDFVDDKKDAGEMGAGHTVTALYEIMPQDGTAGNSGLKSKYTQTTIRDEALSTDELLNVRIRYKALDGNTSKEFNSVLRDGTVAISETSDNFRFSAAVAMFGMYLHDSEFKGNTSLAAIRQLAHDALGNDPFGYRNEFLTLVDRVTALKTAAE